MMFKKTLNAYDVETFTTTLKQVQAAAEWLNCLIIAAYIDHDEVSLHIPPDVFLARFDVFHEYRSGTRIAQYVHFETVLEEYNNVRITACEPVRGDK